MHILREQQQKKILLDVAQAGLELKISECSEAEEEEEEEFKASLALQQKFFTVLLSQHFEVRHSGRH